MNHSRDAFDTTESFSSFFRKVLIQNIVVLSALGSRFPAGLVSSPSCPLCLTLLLSSKEHKHYCSFMIVAVLSNGEMIPIWTESSLSRFGKLQIFLQCREILATPCHSTRSDQSCIFLLCWRSTFTCCSLLGLCQLFATETSLWF